MNRLDSLSDRALDLASTAGDRIRDLAPRANDWLDAGAKLGALKGASKVGLKVAKRNPVVLGAALAGAGLLWYAARRRAKRAEAGQGETLEGSARRVDARNGDSASDGNGRRTASRSTSARRGTRAARATRESRTEH